MSRPRTRICANETCDVVFEYKRSTARFHSATCRKQAQRRKHQQLAAIEELQVVYRHDRPGHKREGQLLLPIDDGRWERGLDWILRKVALSPERRAEETWEEILWQAVEDLVWALHRSRRSAEFQHIKPVVAVRFWKRKYANHPELLTAVPKFYEQAREARAAIEKERRQARMDAVAEELRGLRRDMAEGFANIEARLAEINLANPDDRDFARELQLLLEEERS